jgi:hypothetical protein
VLVLVLVLVLVSAAAADTGWDLKAPDKVELVAGAAGTLTISIAVDRGLSISKDAGVIIDLAPEGGLAVKRRRLGRGDAVDPEADSPRFAIPLHVESPGDYRLKLHVQFWLCGQKVCRPADARRTIAVTATAAAPTPPP